MTSRLFGPRTVLEAAFCVAVPIVALAAGLHAWAIIAAAAAGYLLVVALEATLAQLDAAGERPTRTTVAAPPPPAYEPLPMPAPPPPTVPLPVEQVEPEPEPQPEDEPVDAPPPPVLEAVPDLEPLPPVAPIPRPVWSNVVPIGISGAPRRWSLWDLERLTKENAGSDAAADEERQFLLLYLRDFADADGMLPSDFDQLVRDSFGTLVAM